MRQGGSGKLQGKAGERKAACRPGADMALTARPRSLVEQGQFHRMLTSDKDVL